jgi:hypothetical protein
MLDIIFQCCGSEKIFLKYRQSIFMKIYGTDTIEVLTWVMTLFLLLFMIITTYAYIFFISSYGWIRIRIFFRILSYSDPQHCNIVRKSEIMLSQNRNIFPVNTNSMPFHFVKLVGQTSVVLLLAVLK